jgi:hypothetical protein
MQLVLAHSMSLEQGAPLGFFSTHWNVIESHARAEPHSPETVHFVPRASADAQFWVASQ